MHPQGTISVHTKRTQIPQTKNSTWHSSNTHQSPWKHLPPTVLHTTKQTKLGLLCLALLLTEDNHFADCLALLFGTLCVSMSVFFRMHTACHSWSLATPPTAHPAASCHCWVPTHSLTVWPKCLGNQNRPESWVSPGQLPLPVIWEFTQLIIWSILCLFICLLFSAYTYLFLELSLLIAVWWAIQQGSWIKIHYTVRCLSIWTVAQSIFNLASSTSKMDLKWSHQVLTEVLEVLTEEWSLSRLSYFILRGCLTVSL